MEYAIVFDNFTKKYGNFTAVDNISLDIEKSLITGFVGKNGAGKSTTMHTMMNMIFPTEGFIKIMGLDSVSDAKAIKNIVSYMPSDVSYYEHTKPTDIFKLCASIGKLSYDYALELASYFELDINKQISSLSLGNRKKVSIIIALLKNSDIFILDEPTNGLDPLMQEKFFKKILEMKSKGSTIFLSSHNMGEIEKYCDRAVIIKNGKITTNIDMHTKEKSSKYIISYTEANGVKQNFESEDSANNIIERLHKLDLDSVEIRRQTIEEEFIKFYEDSDREMR